MEDREDLLSDIEKTVTSAKRSARSNYYAAFIFTFTGVAGSIGATILAALGAPPGNTALVAAIPAAVLSINSVFHFERKSAWHWKKVKLLEGLVRALRFENEEVATISRAFSRIDGELDEKWVNFGSHGHSPE